MQLKTRRDRYRQARIKAAFEARVRQLGHEWEDCPAMLRRFAHAAAHMRQPIEQLTTIFGITFPTR